MKISAGILLYRRTEHGLQVLLAHPGGPFWARKDLGAWTLPKGELEPGEEPAVAAVREVSEELGLSLAGQPLLPLGTVRQNSGKIVHGWACEHDFDPDHLVSNLTEIEWPHGSGRMHRFPEVDRAAWFDLTEAAARILPGQKPFLARLVEVLPPPKP